MLRYNSGVHKLAELRAPKIGDRVVNRIGFIEQVMDFNVHIFKGLYPIMQDEPADWMEEEIRER